MFFVCHNEDHQSGVDAADVLLRDILSGKGRHKGVRLGEEAGHYYVNRAMPTHSEAAHAGHEEVEDRD